MASKYIAESGGWSPSMLNPLYPLFGNGTERYHAVFDKLWKNGPAAAGWLTERTLDAALLGAAILGGARGIKWLYDLGDSPSGAAKGIHKQVGTTFTYGKALEKGRKKRREGADSGQPEENGEIAKKARLVPNPSAVDPVTSAIYALIPSAALLASGMAAYKLVDNAADKSRTLMVKRDLARNGDTVRRLIEARARLANGNATDAEVEKTLADTADAGYVKSASFTEWFGNAWDKLSKHVGRQTDSLVRNVGPADAAAKTVKAITLLTLATMPATAVGSYALNKKRNADNQAFKAYEKGLREYARMKTETAPLTITADDEMLARIARKDTKDIDGGVREQPEAQATRRPTMLTLD